VGMPFRRFASPCKYNNDLLIFIYAVKGCSSYLLIVIL